MHHGAWIATKTLTLAAVLALALTAGEARAANLLARWLGQDGHDLVGGEPGPAKNDYQDIHIAIKGLPADRAVASVVITGEGSGEWKTSNKDRFTVLVVRQPRSTLADLYVEPYMRETGRQFDIKLKLDDGQEASITIQGGKADPDLRAPGTGLEARWLGQDGQDRTGTGPGVGPDGSEDVHLALSKLSSKFEIKTVEVTGPGGLAWHAGQNPKGLPSAELIRQDDKTRADLYFSPPRDLAGQTLKIVVSYDNDRRDLVSVAAAKCSPTKAVAKVTAPNLASSAATARWLGQDGVQTGLGDVHVVLEGLAPNRQIVAAALSDGVAGTWIFKSGDHVKFEAGDWTERLNVRRASASKADLAFPPIRDGSGTTMTLRLLDQSGREEVIRFLGGPSDPGLRAPELPPGSVTAKPGDDLQGLVGRFGTVTLAKGVYPLSKPLVLAKGVRIVGEAGSILRFSQGGDQPPWTTAIKIHAGGTTLEGFAVRFEGAFRWDREVSFGASVIGTTDDRDDVPKDPKYRITLARLDLEGPPASSAWEEAVHMIRVVSASSGRIEGNVLKGGAVKFGGGPWTISGNTHKGTLPNTFCFEVFSARYTHDLTLVGNKATVLGPSGKTWRFLVLTQRGANDLVKDNVVEGGVGPREDDARQHSNTPELILTEAYRLHFEGKPAAISTDGRVVVIPQPQGDEAGTGDALAILSGPQAGQWRTIAQRIGPRTYLLDEPIARETDAISIATGFVRETFEGNTVDCRGSGIAADFVLAGNHFGARVIGNHFLGGGESVRLMAAPTESPVHWGWSHAPFLGARFEGNTLEDARGGAIGVEHSSAIKANKGRVYMTLTMKDNTLRWSRSPGPSSKPPNLMIGFPSSLDPGEFVILEEGTKIEGADARAAWVHAATINGKVVEEAPLTARGPVGSKAAKAKAPRSSRRD
jgi:hypothetical protein